METILIVANPYEAARIGRSLEPAGYRAVMDDGRGVEPLIVQANPLAIVLSLRLSRASGADVVAAVRGTGRGANLPIVLVASPDDDIASEAAAKAFGADDVLQRPFSAEGLLEKLSALSVEPRAPEDITEPPASTPGSSTPHTPHGQTMILDDETPGGEPIAPAETGARTRVHFDPEPPDTDGGATQMMREQTAIDPSSRAAVDDDLASETDEGSITQELMREIEALDSELFPDADDPFQLYDEGGELDTLDHIDLSDILVDTGSGQFSISGEFGSISSGSSRSPLEGDALSSRRGGTHGRRGQLAAVPLPYLLVRLFDSGYSGKLILRRDDAEKSLYLDEGRVVFAASNLPRDRLVERLRRDGAISAEEYHEIQQVELGGEPVGNALIQRGMIRESELVAFVRSQLTDIVFSLFGWTRGLWALSAQRLVVGQTIRLDLHPLSVVAEGIRRKFDQKKLAELFEDGLALQVAREPTETEQRHLEVSPALLALIADPDGPKTVGAFVSAAEDPLVAYQALYMLFACGVLVKPADPDPAASDAFEQESEDLAIDRRRVETKFEQVRCGDYFTLLAIDRDATSHEVLRAYEKAKRLFESSEISSEVARGYERELEQIRDVLDEAFWVLRDDNRRLAYRARLGDSE